MIYNYFSVKSFASTTFPLSDEILAISQFECVQEAGTHSQTLGSEQERQTFPLAMVRDHETQSLYPSESQTDAFNVLQAKMAWANLNMVMGFRFY
jgi:hypothetical protein